MIDPNTHRQIVSTPYYEDNTRISNSAIGWFINKGPAYLHSMLTGTAEGETGKQLDRGTMIHMYLLQPEEFHKSYVVWDKSRPSSIQQEKFCQELAQSVEIEPNRAVLSAYRESYSVTTLSDEKVLPKALKLASELTEYIDFLKSGDTRKMITPFEANQLMQIAENIQAHKKAKELLKNEYVAQEDELFHEFHINWEYYGDGFVNIYKPDDSYNIRIHCKSLLDSIHFDFKNKICTLMDLKTTVHISNFEESVNTYDYCRQMYFYNIAIRWYLENELKLDSSEWKIETYIIAIDTTNTQEIRVFKLKEEQLYSRHRTITDALTTIFWHIKNDLWDHTKEYYEGDGAEKLNL